MRHLILVKHSLPEINLNKPAHEWTLSELGRERCVTLAEHLARYEPGSVVSSDELKAIETASLVAARLGLEPRVEPGLHEHRRSEVPWMEELEWRQMMADFFRRRQELALGDETADQTLARFSAAVDQVIKFEGGAPIVVVAHGTVMSLFAESRTGFDAHQLWRDLHLPSFVVFQASPWAIDEIVNIV